MTQRTLGTLLFLGVVVLTTGCPLSHGHAKKGEKCHFNNDCDNVRCSTQCASVEACKAKGNPEGLCE